MKKRIVNAVAVLVLLLSVFCIYADFNRYTCKTKTIPLGNDGLIFSITTFDGKTETEPFVKCLGHTWLSIDNRTGHSVHLKDYEIKNGEVLTFSVWTVSGHFGVFFNLEADFIRQYHRYVGRQSMNIHIDESQLKTIEEYIRKNDFWTLGKNCSRWAVGLWNEIADEAYRLKMQTLVYTPKRLEKSFEEFDCVEFDKDFSGAKEIFFYQDGIRTELQLCS